MKIFVDENIPLITVETLREFKHDVMDIRGTEHEGMDDDALWKLVQREKRLFITTDKGFSRFRNTPHSGLLIIRLRQPNRMKIHQKVMHAFIQTPENEWAGRMIVMQDTIQSFWQSKGM